MHFLSLIRLLFPLLVWLGGYAAGQETVPPLAGPVVDRTGTLSHDQEAALEGKLQAFEARKGSQIAVLIVPTTGDESIEQYALRVAETWKLGRQGVDDGALFLVAKQDRAVRIEVGYGLEGALNDAVCKRIVSDVIVPRFRQGDFYGGVDAGVTAMIKVAEGEALPPPARPAAGQGADVGRHLPFIFIAVLVLGGLLRTIFGRLLGAAATGGGIGFLAWWLAGSSMLALAAGFFAFLFTLLTGLGRSVGSWGSRPWGGWGGTGGFGGGSFGGGGFRGGGGGFGGGGASGRW